MTGPACGNNPSHHLTDGDRQAVDNFKAHLATQAAIAKTLYDFTPLPEIPWEEAPESDRARYRRRAAAVLAALPAPVDTGGFELRGDTEVRAAALREAADQYAKLTDQNEAYDREHGELDEEARLRHEVVRDVVAGLRRMADETAATETPAAHAAIDRVRTLHRKASHGDTCVYCAHGQRLGYDTTWPCDTIRALDGTDEPAAGARQDGAQR